jgi:hypothetical protein
MKKNLNLSRFTDGVGETRGNKLCSYAVVNTSVMACNGDFVIGSRAHS